VRAGSHGLTVLVASGELQMSTVSHGAPLRRAMSRCRCAWTG
jgi:hypothetical protein